MSQSDYNCEGRKKHRGGARRRQRGAATADGVPMLHWSPHGTNFAKFKHAFAARVESQHGLPAMFLDTYEKAEPKKPEWKDYKPCKPAVVVAQSGQESKGEGQDDDTADSRTEHQEEADDAGITLQLLQVAMTAFDRAMDRYGKKLDQFEMVEYKIFGLIIEKLSAESLDRVKSSVKWAQISKSRDSLELWKLVRDTHNMVGAETASKSMFKPKIRMDIH
mmetsp:Transcript_13719/g.22690  ORF Transcript_13719/g.22690 Transcript_13719/m.22690 type:complete len:220 (+) Transcript_13719:184-843(+)|eukprot:CAMPEP_0114426758 /NCGR_PEP_ID=MMETSP0103-20121206/7973_1 /TAXON_ID=37642 ORGANISM="Paraphysomonas imperforata, Strain PA2" /NCGR_SAMPLE_ID=MMETSP0103 /ASSEMBLY_ACC=CAM_ASM_000201 /LENGTH=219 /DNA_ID=CAMNT_0001595749 /DNA_START=190 /DNA_END=849 /DNA_ORIENTATION=+